MSNQIRVEWVENGKPKQLTVNSLLYQLDNGSWDVAHNVVRLVVTKDGGSKVIKAFLKREPSLFEQRELRARRRNRLFLAGAFSGAIFVVSAGLSMLLL
jgi:hypothetical protein